jgi:flagellin-like hook-associated protein FlgL
MTGIVGYTNRTTLQMSMLADMRWQIDDLQRQLATGKRADTYAALGIGRTLDLEARSRLSRIDAFNISIDQVSLRVDIMNTALDRLRVVGQDVRSDVAFPLEYELIGNGQTQAQSLSALRLDEGLSLLNERAGERYLFSGSATDTRPTATAKEILDGVGARAGLKQHTAERLLADRGPGNRGRLAQPSSLGTVVTFAEDGAHPFGMKIAEVTTDFGAAVTPTAGPPASFAVELVGNQPAVGERVQIRLSMPDGTSVNVELTATAENPPPAGSFLIGANETATAANIAAAADTAIQQIAMTELTAASAMRAGEDFFNIDAANPPQRVDGPPFETATAMRDGTEADTVFWYRGDGASGDARLTSVARIDDTIEVAHGARANEDGMRTVVMSAAVFASMTFSESDPDGRDRYFALAQRVGTELDGQQGIASIEAAQTDLAGAQLSAEAAKERLTEKKASLQGIIDEIENVLPEEVGVKLLSMTTRLQATLQTTAMLSQFNLLNFI